MMTVFWFSHVIIILQVRVGLYLTFDIGRLQYIGGPSSSPPTLIIVIAIVLVIFIILIIVLVIVMKKKKLGLFRKKGYAAGYANGQQVRFSGLNPEGTTFDFESRENRANGKQQYKSYVLYKPLFIKKGRSIKEHLMSYLTFIVIKKIYKVTYNNLIWYKICSFIFQIITNAIYQRVGKMEQRGSRRWTAPPWCWTSPRCWSYGTKTYW